MIDKKKTIHDIRSTLDMTLNFLNLLDQDKLDLRDLDELKNLLRERINQTYEILESMKEK